MNRWTHVLLALLGSAPAALAQCSLQWQTGTGPTGIVGTVHASVAWDPDGAGPLPTRIAYGGAFTVAGDVAVKNIASYDPSTATWSALGSGMNDVVFDLGVATNGDLLAAGNFTIAGGTPANFVARWNGSSWAALGAGTTQPAVALLARSNGDIAIATDATIQQWNGSAWSNIPTGPMIGLRRLAELTNGDLVVGGNFGSVGGNSAIDVARWNGTAWSQIGSGIPGIATAGGEIFSMCATASGDLVVAGNWSTPSGFSAVWRWNGTTWSASDAGLAQAGVLINELRELPGGELIAAGAPITVPAAGNTFTRHAAARWNGSAWSAVGPAEPFYPVANTVVGFGASDVYVAGSFSVIGGHLISNVAHWNGVAWESVNAGTTGSIVDLSLAPNGDVVAVGTFEEIEGVAANNVARWNGSTWVAMDAVTNGAVLAVCALQNGDVLIGGTFTTVNGSPIQSVARWNGSAWTSYGSAWPTTVRVIRQLADGRVAAGGNDGVLPYTAPRVTIWNGASATALPYASGAGYVDTLSELPSGALLMGSSGGGGIGKWDGIGITTFASAFTQGGVQAMAWTPSGQFFAGGNFQTISGQAANFIATWNGTSWSPLGSGTNGRVTEIAALPDGDVLAFGAFTIAGGLPANGVARWNGTSWSATIGGVANVSASALPPSGPLFVGGSFTTVGSSVSAYVARLATTCPAATSTFGAGCPSSGGGNVLAADTPPWVDATFSATGTGLPTTALVLTLTSVTSVPQGLVPLASIFAEGVPGCDVLVAPDILAALVTATGTVTSSFFLPNTPPLVGVTFYHQMIPWEIVAGVVTTITATNALQLTAGAF